MKRSMCLLSVVAFCVSGCSGVIPSIGAGPVVAPMELNPLTGGGSMSTLWYLGSDRRYHHFSHLFKTTTRYRVKREDLDWQPEFPLRSEESVLVGPGMAPAKWRLQRTSGE
ncbi:hypothetical protein [Haloferula rosea]|uniref:hypothetical protein n=1 Tax=Haloferula rosea TaxID=490093 RepID=UPI00190600D0|nr:hypothetical protein [Haloferula rosea]